MLQVKVFRREGNIGYPGQGNEGGGEGLLLGRGGIIYQYIFVNEILYIHQAGNRDGSIRLYHLNNGMLDVFIIIYS